MTTRIKLIIGSLVLMVVLLAGAVIALSGSDDEPNAVSVSDETSSSSTSTSTEATTTSTTTEVAPPTAKAVPATTTTTKKVNPPAILLPDEPNFTSVNTPNPFACGAITTSKIMVVSWSADDADKVDIFATAEGGTSASYTGQPASGSANIVVNCTKNSIGLIFRATGPGGITNYYRTVPISH